MSKQNQGGGGGGGSKAPARAVTDKKKQVKVKVKTGPSKLKGYVVKGKDADHPNLMFSVHPIANKIAQGEWIIRHKALRLNKNEVMTQEDARKVREIMVNNLCLKRGLIPANGDFLVLKYRFKTDRQTKELLDPRDQFMVHPKGSPQPRNWDPVSLRLLGYSSLRDGSQDHLAYKEAEVLRRSLINKILLRLGKELMPIDVS